MSTEVRDFVRFLMSKSFLGQKYEIKPDWIDLSLAATLADSRYSFLTAGMRMSLRRLFQTEASFPCFFTGLVARFARQGEDSRFSACCMVSSRGCGCEIYFSNAIGVGFSSRPRVGMVVGSRNKIGKGFRIYQGSTVAIGHPERRGIHR